MKQPRELLPTSVFVVSGFLLMGIVSMPYYIIDLTYHDSGGDMYGLMVLACLWQLGMPAVVLIGGTILFVSALVKKSKGLRRAGSALVIIASVVLLLMALSASRARKQREIRQAYLNKSTEELLRMVRDDDEESGWAMHVLQRINDPEAEPALCKILLDERERVNLRADAAYGLGRIGGKEGREALEKVLASNPAEPLMNAVKYALEERMILEKAFEDSKADD